MTCCRSSAACVFLVRSVLLSVTLGGVSPSAAGQQSTGTLEGVVRDPTGAVVPGARITLTDPLTMVAVSQTSDPRGAFVFVLVPPGRYKVDAAQDGFKTLSAIDVVLRVTESVNLVLTLEPGGIQETVTVQGAAVRVGMSGGAIGAAIDARLIRDLPNFTRNSLDLVNLAPAVDLLPGGQASTGQIIGVDGGSVLANAARRSQNSYYLDGAENAGAWRNSALQFPNPDTIDAVQVQTANAGAQFGKQPGAVINVVTRSGTNEFSGTVFHFLHDERLNAGRWADNRAGLQKPADNQTYSGAVLGGPARKNRTFFFASFNTFRTNDSVTQQSGRFPTQAMMGGDFSAVPDFVRADGTAVPFNIMDPVTGAPLGKSIPRSMMDPAALRLLDLLPTAANYYDRAIRQFDRPVRNNEYLLKLDHVITSNQQVSGLALLTYGGEKDPAQSFAANTVPAWGALERYGRQITAVAKHRWTAAPKLSVETRFSLVESSSRINPSDQSRDLHDLGIMFPFTARIKQLPGLRLDAQGGFRADHANTDFVAQRNHRMGATAVWTRGRNIVRLGAETQVDRVSFESSPDLRTVFQFTGRDTLNGPITSASQVPLSANNFGVQNFAYAWADFLLGRVGSFTVAGFGHALFRYRSNYLFAEDQWGVTDRLTVNLGLRYELAGDVTEAFGQFGGAFVAGHQSDQYPNAPVGLAWAGDRGLPRGLSRRDRDDLAPQVGVAYDVRGNGKTVLRGAAGLYYASRPLASRINSGTSGFGGASTGGANALLSDPFGTSKVNPFDTVPQYGSHNQIPDAARGYTPVTFPWDSLFQTQFVRGVPTRIFSGSIVGYDPDMETPSSFQTNLVLEREIGRGLMVSGGYVGNRGYHQPMWRALNAPVPGEGGNTSEQSLRDRRPLPTYGPGRLYSTILSTSYDSLQIWATVRSRGLTATSSYVLARALSPFGINATGAGESTPSGFSEGSASADTIFDSSSGTGQTTYPYDVERDRAEMGRRHTFKLHGVYDLPGPREQSHIAGNLLGGWSVSGAFQAASGIPLNVTWGLDANADGSAADRPNLVGSIDYPQTLVPNPGADRQGAIQYISSVGFIGPCNTNDRTGPAAFCTSVGNLARNAARGVGLFNLDLALLKDVRMGGPRRFQFRLEVFNVTNSNFLSGPTLNLSSPFFGQVVGRNHRPRQMQVGAKLGF